MDFAKQLGYYCKLFNRYQVDYLVIGGVAVALHGHYRQSMSIYGVPVDKPDLDFWYNPSYENYYRLLGALKEIGRDVEEYLEEQIPNPKESFFKFDLPECTLEILPAIKISLNFQTAFARKEVAELDDVTVPFICLTDLIDDKLAVGRPKDQADVHRLADFLSGEDFIRYFS